MAELPIGKLAAASCCAVQTIRFYEQIGILPRPSRSAGNQRRYDRDHLRRLQFIRHARALGLKLDDIAALLGMANLPDSSCASADAIIRRQLRAVRSRISSLQALAMEFERMLEQCRGGKIAECRVIEVLSDHSQCAASAHGDADEEGGIAAVGGSASALP